jgi:hypothetical protein
MDAEARTRATADYADDADGSGRARNSDRRTADYADDADGSERTRNPERKSTDYADDADYADSVAGPDRAEFREQKPECRNAESGHRSLQTGNSRLTASPGVPCCHAGARLWASPVVMLRGRGGRRLRLRAPVAHVQRPPPLRLVLSIVEVHHDDAVQLPEFLLVQVVLGYDHVGATHVRALPCCQAHVGFPGVGRRDTVSGNRHRCKSSPAAGAASRPIAPRTGMEPPR